MSRIEILTASLLTITTLAAATPSNGQTRGFDNFRDETARALTKKHHTEEVAKSPPAQDDTELHFKSRSDSLDWARNKALAERSAGFRIIVSLQAHHLWVMAEEDT